MSRMTWLIEYVTTSLMCVCVRCLTRKAVYVGGSERWKQLLALREAV